MVKYFPILKKTIEESLKDTWDAVSKPNHAGDSHESQNKLCWIEFASKVNCTKYWYFLNPQMWTTFKNNLRNIYFFNRKTFLNFFAKIIDLFTQIQYWKNGVP